QIYGAMQTDQEKMGMQTLNQSLASLYMSRQITFETALTASSLKEELIDMINRGVGVVGVGAAPGRPPLVGRKAAGKTKDKGPGTDEGLRTGDRPRTKDEGQRTCYADIRIFGTHTGRADGERRAHGRLNGRRGGRAAP